MSSPIEPHTTRLVCFAKENFGKSIMIENYCCTLVYANMYGEKYFDKCCWRGVVSVITTNITGVLYISTNNGVKDGNGRSHVPSIVLAQF